MTCSNRLTSNGTMNSKPEPPGQNSEALTTRLWHFVQWNIDDNSLSSLRSTKATQTARGPHSKFFTRGLLWLSFFIFCLSATYILPRHEDPNAKTRTLALNQWWEKWAKPPFQFMSLFSIPLVIPVASICVTQVRAALRNHFCVHFKFYIITMRPSSLSYNIIHVFPIDG
jgi:hypothetical protein